MGPRPGPPDLYARAAAAWGEGRQQAAAELLEALVETEPGHAAALNTLGMIALNFGDARRAAEWLERAAAAEPESAPIWFNLFQARDSAGEPERGLASLDRALTADPNYLPAILMKADVLQRLGRGSESLALYRAIIASDPPTDLLPEPARRSFERGLALVRADDDRAARALEGPLAELQAAWPDADFERARAYLEHRTGRRKVYVQQPVNGHFPYLPALEFFPREHFPWLPRLEAETDRIRSELVVLLDDGAAGFAPYVAFDPTLPANQWAELNHSRRWSAWFFWKDGERQDSNCARCPHTAALIESLPLLDLPGKGPTAMFSILDPRTRIPPHTGSSNVRATIHLPLVVPPGCGLRVGSQTRPFEAGKAWAFDDTIEHEAWNDSDRPRAILILDSWNPLLSEAERAAVRLIG
ncbi:MAG TPA: aspartyl/asparaginyl beta-hydroxylase domain-containing protein [Allosphingosinicella sp.]|nr:aspartyl/asparaginyl beta-hydroxylase domain-containing protein [Allosphingosinicella sp.]